MSKRSRRYNNPDFNFVPEDIQDYSNTTQLSYLCSADDILDRIKYDSSIIFKNLRQGIFDLEKVLPVDKKCLCNLGQGKRPFVNRNTCVGCELMRRIFTTIKVPESKIVTIEVGKYLGKKIKINTYNKHKYEKYEKCSYQTSIMKILSTKEHEMFLLDKSFNKIYNNTTVYSTDSPVSNYINTCVFINNKLHKYRIPTLTPFEWSFECGNNIHIIEPLTMNFIEVSSISELQKNSKLPTAQTKVNSLNTDIVISVLKQLISLLHFLSKYSFIHGYPNIDFLRFLHKPCSYKYNDVLIDSPITLLLKPSFLTSFAYETDEGKNVRLVISKCSKNLTSIDKFPVESTDIIINYKKSSSSNHNYEIPILPEIENNLVYTYKIGRELPNFINFMQNHGMPLLHSSFEFYCFLVALLCEHSFYTSFMEHDVLCNIWYNLWKTSEYDSVSEGLNALSLIDHVDHDSIVKFVSRFHLRSDGLKYFWDCLSLI